MRSTLTKIFEGQECSEIDCVSVRHSFDSSLPAKAHCEWFHEVAKLHMKKRGRHISKRMYFEEPINLSVFSRRTNRF